MGIALIKIKIMPTSPEVNLKQIEEKVQEILKQNEVKHLKFEIEPIAFGLEALIVMFEWPEEKELEPLEENLRKINNVNSAEVIDMRTLRPLDTQTVLDSVKKTNRIVTVEEGWPVCSIGSEICAVVACEAFDYLDAPPTKVTGADVPMPYAANLEKLALPSTEKIVDTVKSVCYSNF